MKTFVIRGRLILSFILFVYSLSSNAAVTNQIQVKGKLKAILDDVVLLEVKAGDSLRTVKIRKSDVGNLQGIVVGKALLVVQTSFSDFVQLNKDL